MLFPILQNEKEKNATTYEAIEIFELSAYKLPQVMISTSFSFMWNTAGDLPDKKN